MKRTGSGRNGTERGARPARVPFPGADETAVLGSARLDVQIAFPGEGRAWNGCGSCCGRDGRRSLAGGGRGCDKAAW